MISPSEQAVDAIGTADPAAIRISALEAENSALRSQLEWFKRQIFGRKSEKQILLNADQQSLFAAQAPAQAETPGKLVREHRRRTRRSGDEVNDSGLRFDDTVPQTIVEVPAPELAGEQADQYEIIGFKDSVRLAQLRSIFRVLIYRRPIVRHKGEQSVSTPAVPEAVLEGSYADVSLLAGLRGPRAGRWTVVILPLAWLVAGFVGRYTPVVVDITPSVQKF